MTISPNNDAGSSQKTPAVTIVIPVYNSSRYISETLDSVKAQTFTDYEVIVVNDGSDDGDELEQILKSHPLSVTYIWQENKGVSAARNAAIAVARGEFYAQLDADDQWTPNYLEVQLGILAADPGIALVYPNATIIGDETQTRLEFMEVSPSEGEVTFETLVQQRCTVMTSVTARMKVIKDAGMFDESLRSCEDFDLWLRISKSGGRIIYHRNALVLYRRHEASLSSDRVWMTRHLLRVFEKAARTFDLTVRESSILDEQIIANRASLALFEGKHALGSGDTQSALIQLEAANRYMNSPKLAVVIFLLRRIPNLVGSMYRGRERVLMRRAKHQLRGIDNPRVNDLFVTRTDK